MHRSSMPQRPSGSYKSAHPLNGASDRSAHRLVLSIGWPDSGASWSWWFLCLWRSVGSVGGHSKAVIRWPTSWLWRWGRHGEGAPTTGSQQEAPSDGVGNRGRAHSGMRTRRRPCAQRSEGDRGDGNSSPAVAISGACGCRRRRSVRRPSVQCRPSATSSIPLASNSRTSYQNGERICAPPIGYIRTHGRRRIADSCWRPALLVSPITFNKFCSGCLVSIFEHSRLPTWR